MRRVYNKIVASKKLSLKELEEDLVSAKLAFEIAKQELYKLTATAKLGEPAFEVARENALKATKQLEVTELEVERARKRL